MIALDTPTDPSRPPTRCSRPTTARPASSSAATRGRKATELGLVPKIAMLDGAPGIPSGVLRHEGFLEGFGIAEGDPQIAGAVNTEGNEVKGRRGMARLLRDDPDINVVYTINEPAALGAATRCGRRASAGRRRASSRSTAAVRRSARCRPGLIDATAQQYPERMAREGIAALAAIARGGPKPSGYHDTGVELITATGLAAKVALATSPSAWRTAGLQNPRPGPPIQFPADDLDRRRGAPGMASSVSIARHGPPRAGSDGRPRRRPAPRRPRSRTRSRRHASRAYSHCRRPACDAPRPRARRLRPATSGRARWGYAGDSEGSPFALAAAPARARISAAVAAQPRRRAEGERLILGPIGRTTRHGTPAATTLDGTFP